MNEHLARLADEFIDWAAGERLLASKAMAARPASGEEHPEGAPQGRRRITSDVLEAELGADLQAIEAVLREDPAHFVGISPHPAALVVGHTRRAAGPRPHRTSSGIKVEWVSGKAPEMRLASAPLKPSRTRHGGAAYPCGTSISLGNVMGAGTLSALVEDASGNLFGLSCNHVIGQCNHTDPGTQVVAPGLLDVQAGSLDPFTLGHQDRLLELAFGTPPNVNIADNLDAALFRVRDASAVSSMQQVHYDTPTATHSFNGQVVVQKVGRTTGLTTGLLVGQARRNVPTTVDVGPIRGTLYYTNMFLVLSTHGEFADRGDSGALVVTEGRSGTRQAVGIIFAVSPDRTKTYVAPIHDILARLRVRLKGGHNGARTQGPAVSPAAPVPARRVP